MVSYSKGKWISDNEFKLLEALPTPNANESILDVGCGTGYFSRCFSKYGLHVTGLDLDIEMLDFAQYQDQKITFVQSSATTLPFKNLSFDYSTAITSLCFVENPVNACVVFSNTNRIHSYSRGFRCKCAKRLYLF